MLCIRDYILYERWNELFIEINKSMQPVDEYYQKQSRELKKATMEVLYK